MEAGEELAEGIAADSVEEAGVNAISTPASPSSATELGGGQSSSHGAVRRWLAAHDEFLYSLTHIHAARHAERIEENVRPHSISQERHIFFRQNL